MKEEIKEILDYLKIENGTIGSELSYEETHLLLDYITNLQEENERLKKDCQLLYKNGNKDYLELEREYIDYQKQTEKITIDLTKKQQDYKSRNENAIEDIDLVIELIKQQPTEDDTWILNRLNGFKYLLQGVDKSE